MNLRLITLIIAIFAAQSVLHAQGSIHGHLIDSATRKPLTLATLSVFKLPDTTLVAYRLSDPAGNFRISGLPLNTPCYIAITFVGYRIVRKNIRLNNDAPLDLGTIPMTAGGSSDLQEAFVTAERPPIRVYKDTIEFDAAAFKTLPDALVEDLLRKLPGVDIDKDGNILVNGKPVNRILVDGKRFFGDDPKMATRDLPANAIDKVQVTDDQEQIDRSPDGDMTRIGKVINLTLKKSIKKGWFGKAYAGGGTDQRYQLGGIANIYRDTIQLSVLAFSNNTNSGGFTIGDISSMSGLTRSGIQSVSVRSSAGSAGMSINGINFGGGDQGENKYTGAGFNLNHTPNKNFSFYTQYFFGYNNTFLKTLNDNQQFINDTAVTTLTNTQTNKDFFSHVANIGFNYHSDHLLDISFRAGGNYNTTASTAGALLSTTNSKLGDVNAGNSILGTNRYNGSFSHNFYLTKKYRRHPGRILNFTQSLQYQGDAQHYTTLSNTVYYYPYTDTLLFDQLRKTETPVLNVNTNVGFVDPLSAHWSLRLNAAYNYLRSRYGVGIYNSDPVTEHYDDYVAALSNGNHRIQNIATGNALLVYTVKQWTVTAGLALTSQHIDNSFNTTIQGVDFSLLNLLPSLAITWKAWRLQYGESITVPDIAYLSPVPDSTNPNYIVYGNPALRPAHRRNFNLSFFKARQGGWRADANVQVGLMDNDVILSRMVAANGTQSVLPINADNTFRTSVGGSAGRDFRGRHLIFTARLRPQIFFTDQLLLVNGNTGRVTTTAPSASLLLGFNFSDKVEIDPDYTYSVSSTHYSIPAFQSFRVTTQYANIDVIVRAPGKLIWENKILYRHTAPVAAGQTGETLLWNAAVGYPILPNNKAQLKFSAFDLLNRNSDFNAYTAGNAIINQTTNVLQRYFLLTFTYNIQDFNAGNTGKGGKYKLFQF